MFKKLRNKLILINLGITTLVIIIVFAAIYIIYMRAANGRPPVPDNIQGYSSEVEELIEGRVQEEKDAAARGLLIMLVVSGVAIELAVALGSYYLAEEAIKPVKEAYEAQKIFIANASHEIKTPLAAISANLEAADIQDNKWINNVECETEKLTKLNNELLNLARTDLVNNNKKESIDVAKTTNKVLDSMQARMHGISFTKNIKNTGIVQINTADFTQILEILMDNAIKYSNKKISLTLDTHGLVVRNDGKIISKQDLPHIFERFYQADKSAEGVGLGLAIAKSLANRNGWELSVQSKNGMTEFILKY